MGSGDCFVLSSTPSRREWRMHRRSIRIYCIISTCKPKKPNCPHQHKFHGRTGHLQTQTAPWCLLHIIFIYLIMSRADKSKRKVDLAKTKHCKFQSPSQELCLKAPKQNARLPPKTVTPLPSHSSAWERAFFCDLKNEREGRHVGGGGEAFWRINSLPSVAKNKYFDSATPFSLARSNEKNNQFMMGNEYFEQICKNNSWAPNDLRKEILVFQFAKPSKLTKSIEDANFANVCVESCKKASVLHVSDPSFPA